MRGRSEKRLYSKEQSISNNALAALVLSGLEPAAVEKKLGISRTFGYSKHISDSVLAAVAEMTGVAVYELEDVEYAEDLLRDKRIDYGRMGR